MSRQSLFRFTSTLLMVWLLAQTAVAQVDTLFRLSPDRRILRLWQASPFVAIIHSPFLKANDSTRVFAQLDRLAQFAQQHDDERLFWTAQLHKILFRHTLLEAEHKPSTILEAAEKYMNQCPVLAVQASYWFYRGRYYFENQRFDEGFRWLLRAQHAFEQIGYGHIPQISEYLYAIGDTYYFFGEYATCIRYMVAALRYPGWENRIEVSIHNTIGLCYERLQQYTKAQRYFTKTLELVRIHNDSAYIAIAHTNLGHQLLLRGKPRQALPYLYNGYRFSWLRRPQHEVPENAALADVFAAQALLALDSVAKARQHLDRSTRLFTNRLWSNYDLEYYQARLTYHKRLGNYRLAMVFMDSIRQLEKSLQVKFNSRLLLANQARIDTERYARMEADKQNAIQLRNIILVALVLLTLTGFYALRQNQQKRLQERKVLLQQKQQAEELLTQYMANIQEKNLFIDTISAELDQAEMLRSPRPTVKDLVDRVILTEADWQQFKQLFNGVYPGFFSTLRQRYPDLTGAEIRLLALSKLRIDTRQMSRMLGISPESIRKTKYRMHKKLDVNGKLGLSSLLSEGDLGNTPADN